MIALAAGLLPALALSAQTMGAPPVLDFSTSAAVPGAWSYRSVPAASEAWFIDTSGGIPLTIQCTRATRQVTVARPSSAPAASMFIWTSTLQRNLPALFEQPRTRVSAIVAGRDPLLDAIAFSRGRFAVVMPGVPPLVVSPGPEAARVFEDCRN